MALFGNKKQDQGYQDQFNPNLQNPGLGNDPSNQFAGMPSQGPPSNQMAENMRQQGYNSQQIFDAMNSAEPYNAPAGPIDNFSPDNQGFPEQEAENDFPSAPEKHNHHFSDSKETIEEMAEAIIDEKWEELVKSINKIIEWKEKIESDVTKLEQQVKDIKDNFTNLQSSIIGKINEYDKNIVNVGTEVRAMEKVFEKVLPTFTENVGELRRIIKNSKAPSTQKTKK